MVCGSLACATQRSSPQSPCLPYCLYPALHLIIEGAVHSAAGITEAPWWDLDFLPGLELGTQIPASGPSPALTKHCPLPMPLNWTQMASHLTFSLWLSRCWFGKKPGVYTDYIYQGPMILVLLVRSWAGGGKTEGQSVPPVD